jgi:hypothetical protein
LLETVLVNVWNGTGNRLNRTRLKQTRKALSEIRAIYRFKGERGTHPPSKLNYQFDKNRAGYLAAFGERHAYLSFLHLKNVQNLQLDAIPQPHGKRNELIITSLGAGACIELYGICQFYLGEYQQRLQLKLNSVEKAREWVPNRHIVFARVLKGAFPKISVDPVDIDVDLLTDAIPKFAPYYDRLANTDILLIYNVMNEIPSTYAKKVWRNIKFLLDIFQKPTLILLMEPSADKAQPRIQWLKEYLAHETEIIEEKKEDIFYFDTPPTCIDMDGNEDDLNYRLFGETIEGSKPTFETTIQRSHMSCIKKPDSPISMEHAMSQLSRLEKKRGKKGTFSRQQHKQQPSFSDLSKDWS